MKPHRSPRSRPSPCTRSGKLAPDYRRPGQSLTAAASTCQLPSRRALARSPTGSQRRQTTRSFAPPMPPASPNPAPRSGSDQSQPALTPTPGRPMSTSFLVTPQESDPHGPRRRLDHTPGADRASSPFGVIPTTAPHAPRRRPAREEPQPSHDPEPEPRKAASCRAATCSPASHERQNATENGSTALPDAISAIPPTTPFPAPRKLQPARLRLQPFEVPIQPIRMVREPDKRTGSTVGCSSMRRKLPGHQPRPRSLKPVGLVPICPWPECTRREHMFFYGSGTTAQPQTSSSLQPATEPRV